jgi:outer membrane protein assembly factor BamE (lipoprotein component of BamABCDE complex)
MRFLRLALCAGLAGCAAYDVSRVVTPGMAKSEVGALVGKPVSEGRLADNELYWDYTRQPYGYYIYRITFGPDERVREVRNLLTPENIRRLQPGMSQAEVSALVGVSPERRAYANGTRSWSYRYQDYGVIKLLHVVFDSGDRVLWSYSEWDPRVYSKKDGAR